MLDNQLPELQKYYRAEMLRKAERCRLCKALPESNGNSGVHGPVLARVGKVLSAMGNGLQERYGDTDKGSIPTGEYELRAAS